MLLIYTPFTSAELIYTIDTLFKDIIGIDYSLIDDKEVFLTHKGPKFYYGNTVPESTIGITASTYFKDLDDTIFESFISIPLHSLPIDEDWIAFAFFLLSRKEEYNSTALDQYERFNPEHSILFRKKWLQIPVIDCLCFQIKRALTEQYQCSFNKNTYKVALSFDIDRAYDFNHLSLGYRIIKLFKKALLSPTNAWRILQKLLQGKDPFFTFSAIEYLSSKFEVCVFFLLSKQTSYDTAYTDKVTLQKAVKHLKNTTIGIHPGYDTMLNAELLQQDHALFKALFDSTPLHSRQHYLRLSIPETYQNLIAMGIMHDYTMGYASEIGFRAGTSHAFYWFNLHTKEKTQLTVHSFMAMDQTLIRYQNASKESIETQLNQMLDILKKTNGTASFLLHNNSLSGYREYAPFIQALNTILGQDFKAHETYLY